MKFQGPAFPSYFDQRTPAPRMQWKAHCGKRAQLRNLRHLAKPYLEDPDPAVQAAIQRITEATKNEPMPEFGKLHLIAAAYDAHDQTGESWLTAATYLMDKFDAMEQDAAEKSA